MEQALPNRSRRYTVEEYLALDGTSDVKHEYWDGRLIPHGGWETDAAGRVIGIAGGTDAHGDIASNLNGELRGAIRAKGKACKVVGSDLRVWSPRSGRYQYPDVSVSCGPREFHPPESRVTLANPRVIIEVLSPSTESRDRGEKFRDYIEIPSLQEYLLVAQDRPRVETFRRNAAGTWAVGPWAEGLDATIEFPSLEVSLTLAQVYADVELSPLPDC